jgi:hypothetical protein
VVYLNCDSERSNFWIYFVDNFEKLGLKKIVATHFSNRHPVYKLEYTGTTPVKTLLSGNGDFRNSESIDILKEADVVVSNPPFSLFREYIAQLIEYDKKFLVVGPLTSVGHKSIFQLFKNNQIWLGDNLVKEFVQPNGEVKKFGNVHWFTNLQEPEHRFFSGTKLYSKEAYPKYDNYDAIEIGKIVDIPVDYYGEMGVPISFLMRYNPQQFEIVRFRKNDNREDLRVNGENKYSRIVIKRV